MFTKLFDMLKLPHNKRLRTVIKSFLITVFSVLIFVGVGIFIWNRTIVPPEIVVPTGPIAVPPTNIEPPQTNNTEQYNDENIYDEPTPEYVWPFPERMADDRRELFYTFLIIGLNEGTNVNTAMVASYCAATREANLISIPRDAPVHATRNGRKMASSYLIGAGGGRGTPGGVAQVQHDVLNVIGFIPDFYVVFDYDAFFAIIDAVGGIEIYVPIRMRYRDPYQNLDIDIMPGLQHMDSATALDFARFRQANRNSGYPSLPDGDFGRIRNQQAVINAVINELLRPSNILQIPTFVNIFNDSVHTNLTIPNMMFFAMELNHVMGTDDFNTYTFLPTHTSGDPHWYEFLNPNAILEIVNRTINPFYQYIELRDINIVRE